MMHTKREFSSNTKQNRAVKLALCLTLNSLHSHIPALIQGQTLTVMYKYNLEMLGCTSDWHNLGTFATKRQAISTIRWSRNAKLEKLMLAIESQLNKLEMEVICQYVETFNNWKLYPDYNIVEYGNVLYTFWDIRNLYRECGYKWAETASDMKLWESYKRCVGYVARELVKEFHEFSNAK